MRINMFSDYQSMDMNTLDNILSWYYKNGLLRPPYIPADKAPSREVFRHICNVGKVNLETSLLFDDEGFVEDILTSKETYLILRIPKTEADFAKLMHNFKRITDCGISNLIHSDIQILPDILFDNDNDENKLKFLFAILDEDKERTIRFIQISYKADKKYTHGFCDKVVKIMDGCLTRNPLVTYIMNCSINRCMGNNDSYEAIASSKRFFGGRNMFECFESIIEINPDLSAAWCKCFNHHDSPVFVDNIFSYDSYQTLREQLFLKLAKYKKENLPACDFKNCNKINCFGLCPGLSYIKKNKDKIQTEKKLASPMKKNNGVFELGKCNFFINGKSE